MSSGAIRTFRDLLVWRKAVELAVGVYGRTDGFPKEERFGLMSQLRRAGVSVSCNIAEGYGRRSTKDYIRFLHMAMGSLYEVETQLEIARKLDMLDEESFGDLNDRSREIERMLSSLIRKVAS